MSVSDVRRSYQWSGVQRGCKNWRWKWGPPLQYMPCGKCHDCLKSRTSAFAGRHVLELATAGGFGTSFGLTFDDENLSDEHWEPEWWKAEAHRLRSRLQYYYPHLSLRYSMVAELGERTFRPHAHLAIPGMVPPLKAQRMLVPFWKRGHVHAQRYDIGTAYYLSEYLCKPEKRDLLIYRSQSKLYGVAEFEALLARQLEVEAGERRRILGESISDGSFEFQHKRYAMDHDFRERAREVGLVRPFDAEDFIAGWVQLPDAKGNATPWDKRMARNEEDERRAARIRETSHKPAVTLLDGAPVEQMLRAARRSMR